MKPGKHTLSVWAIDAAKNKDPKPVRASWNLKENVK